MGTSSLMTERIGNLMRSSGQDPADYGDQQHARFRDERRRTDRLLDGLEQLCGPAMAAPLKERFTLLYEAGDEAIDGYSRAVAQRTEVADRHQADRDAARGQVGRLTHLIIETVDELRRRHRGAIPASFAALNAYLLEQEVPQEVPF